MGGHNKTIICDFLFREKYDFHVQSNLLPKSFAQNKVCSRDINIELIPEGIRCDYRVIQ